MYSMSFGKMWKSISIVALLSMMAMVPMIGSSGQELEEPTRAEGRTLYVDIEGGSTYMHLFEAADDAQPGDTIIVNEGLYIASSFTEKHDLTVRGNSSNVNVTALISGSGLSFNHCRNITVSNLNIRGAGESWLGDGSLRAAYLNDSHEIVFGFTRFITNINESCGIEAHNSSMIRAFWSIFESDMHRTSAMNLHHCSDISLGGVGIDLPGSGTSVLEAYDSEEVYLSYLTFEDDIETDYLVKAENSLVSTVNMEIEASDLSMDSNSEASESYERRVYLRDENNETKIEGGHLEIVTDGEQTYATPHYGGDDNVSDSNGAFIEQPFLVNRIFKGPAVLPEFSTNTIRAYYDEGQMAQEVDLGEVNAGISENIYIYFDITPPNETVNLTAETFDHETIYLSFENSTSEDVSHYELWYNESAEWMWKMNVSQGGTVSFGGLKPATNYSFKVIVVDDHGLRSNGTVVWNTTDDPVNGTLNGTVVYSDGPMDGHNATNASVHLFNGTMDEVGNVTVGEDGHFEFQEVPFETGWNYTLKAIPEDPVQEGGETSGYTEWISNFTFDEPTEMNVELEYYEYIPPTSGPLSGHISYSGGDMDGENVTNATVKVYNETMAEIASTMSDANGTYLFEDLDFGHNYTLEVAPEDPVEDGGTESGYVTTLWGYFNFTEEMEKNLTVDYYEYVPPTSGPVSGTVSYSGGPHDGNSSVNTTVAILNSTGTELYSTETDLNGNYSFEDMEFGSGYTLVVTPPSELEGVMDVKSGYLVHEEELNHTEGTTIDVSLEYYEKPSDSEKKHPEIKITDEDGDPVEGVKVTAKIDGDTYTATTDGNGIASFTGYDGEEFPAGTEFKATHDDYEEISWEQGDEIPQMKESKRDNTVMVIILVVIVALIILALLFFGLKGRGEDYLEE